MPLVGKPAVADPESEYVELVETRLISTPEVCTSGVFNWARVGFQNPDGREAMVNVIAKTYGLKHYVAYGLLSGEIPSRIEGEDVVFAFPDGWYKAPKGA